MSGTSTLVDFPSPARVRRSRSGRRVFLALLVLFLLLGLSEQLGVRSATASSSADGYRLTVTYAAMTRPGLDTPFDIEVTSKKNLPDEIAIAVEHGYLDLFDENGGLNPEPTDSGADGRSVYWTFTTRGTRSFRASLDTILATGREWGSSGTVALLVGGRTVTSVHIRTWVAP